MNNRLSERAAVVFSLLLLVPSASLEGGKRQLINRSIYVPVSFRLCEHLAEGVLYLGDQAVAPLPTQRIFQFTIYPDLRRLAPEMTEVRIKGVDVQGTDFVARLVVSPQAIYTANEQIDLDMDNQLKKFSYKIDVRYKTTAIVLRCNGSCPGQDRDPGTTTTTAGDIVDDIKSEVNPLRFPGRE